MKPDLSASQMEALRLLVAHGEMYGLEMVGLSQRLRRGTIYITLSTLADMGYVESRPGTETIMGLAPRRLYRATEAGSRAVSER